MTNQLAGMAINNTVQMSKLLMLRQEVKTCDSGYDRMSVPSHQI